MYGSLKKYKTVLILGASSDIGMSVIKKFLEEDWYVYAHANKSTKRFKKFLIFGKKFKFLRCDLNKKNQIKKLIKITTKTKIISYINLVGYLDNISYKKTNLDSLIKSLTINTLVPNLIKRSLITNMVKLKFGRILDLSSIGVKYGGSEFTYNYSFSKHALEYIPSFFKNLTKKNILTNILRVGVVNTRLLRKIKGKNINKRKKLIPIKRLASTQEISETIYNLASEKNTYISGEKITISGGE
tara:strand:- start:1555 stop:2283 length:729 start_codon:yes stop_codon:yes gene_type:complete